MIEFNTSSWHYRFASWSNDNVKARSLCPYVHSVLCGMFMFTVLSAIVCFCIFGTILTIIALLVGGDFSSIPQWISLGFMITICVITSAAIIFVLEEYCKRKRQREYDEHYARLEAEATGHEYTPLQQPPLWRLYFTAVHDKFCPSISFKSTSSDT